MIIENYGERGFEKTNNTICAVSVIDSPITVGSESAPTFINFKVSAFGYDFEEDELIYYGLDGVPNSNATTPYVKVSWKGVGWKTAVIETTAGPTIEEIESGEMPEFLTYKTDWMKEQVWILNTYDAATLSTAGTYTVRLTLTNDAGSVSEDFQVTVVESNPSVEDPPAVKTVFLNPYNINTGSSYRGGSYGYALPLNISFNTNGTVVVDNETLDAGSQGNPISWIYESDGVTVTHPISSELVEGEYEVALYCILRQGVNYPQNAPYFSIFGKIR